jgi:hypothetical protein
MINAKGKEINLCPKNKAKCILNTKEWINSPFKPKKCYDCYKNIKDSNLK